MYLTHDLSSYTGFKFGWCKHLERASKSFMLISLQLPFVIITEEQLSKKNSLKPYPYSEHNTQDITLSHAKSKGQSMVGKMFILHAVYIPDQSKNHTFGPT